MHVTGPTVISRAPMADLLEHSKDISSSSCGLNEKMLSSAPFPSHAVHVKPYEKDGRVIKSYWDENNQTADIIIGELALLHKKTFGYAGHLNSAGEPTFEGDGKMVASDLPFFVVDG